MAVLVDSIDSNGIYAMRSEADKDGNRIDTTYAKLADVPTVPVTDVTVNGTSVVSNGTAAVTVPTATSDITNDSGFITLSDVPPEEVEVLTYGTSTLSDYTAAIQAGKKIIVCKVREPDDGWRYVMQSVSSPFPEWMYCIGVTTYRLRLDYNGVTGWTTLVTNNTTSADSGKVFSVDQYGNQVWAVAQGTTYSAGTGIDITSNTISVENPLPSSTSADEGKVLKVDANGDPEWATGGGGGTKADWAEDDPLEPSYIENKPVPKTLVAGTNITISENSSTLTVAATWQNAQADWTETDPNEPAYIQHKPTLATVATSGDYSDLSNTPTLATVATSGDYSDLSNTPTVDQTYDASSANAQSGVAVADAIGNLGTNLSSAQIQSLKEALGVDETVLYSGMKTIGGDGAATYNLSESPLNFQYIKVYFCANDNTFGSAANVGSSYTEWDTQIYTAPSTFLTVYMDGNASATAITKYAITCDVSGIQTSTWTAHGYLNDATGNAKWFHIFKIVGRHRIASN